MAVLVDPLVARRAGVAHVAAAQLPHDPVRRLDPVVHPGVDLGVLLEQLQPLGELPLRGDPAAVARQPLLAPLLGELVDPVGLRLGRVVLPQLHVGVRPVGELRQLAQRRAVGQDGQHGARGEVRADADHVFRAGACGGERLRHRGPEDVDVVRGDLQRPVRRQPAPGRRQGPVHHRVRVRQHGAAELGSVTDPDHHGPPRQGPEVHPDDDVLRPPIPVLALLDRAAHEALPRSEVRRSPGSHRRARDPSADAADDWGDNQARCADGRDC